MDTLLLRAASETDDFDFISSQFSPGSGTPYVESNASTRDEEPAITRSTSPRISSELRTPQSRSEQLAILLARNYYSAPACSLAYVNIPSSDSGGYESSYERVTTICNANAEKNEQTWRKQPVPTLSIPPVGLESSTIDILRCESSLDDSTQPGNVSNIDLADMPLQDESPVNATDDNAPAVCALMEMHNASEALEAAEKDESVYPLLPLNLPLDPSRVDVSTSPLDTGADEATTVLPLGSIGCIDDAATSPMESAKRSIPVYSRSLLYRIRVPLAQRLKNTCHNFGEYLGRDNRSNTSCERQQLKRVISVSETAHEDPSSAESSLDEETFLNWSPDLMQGGVGDITPPENNGEDIYFWKRRRWTISNGKRKQIRRYSNTESTGLMMSGEFWARGSMRYIGAKFGGVPIVNDRETRAIQTTMLLSRYFSGYSGNR